MNTFGQGALMMCLQWQLSLFLVLSRNENRLKESNKQLHSLNLTITRTPNNLQLNIYKNPFSQTHASQYSSQSSNIKLFAFRSMIHRLVNISLSTSNFKQELVTIKITANSNSYSAEVIENLYERIEQVYKIHLQNREWKHYHHRVCKTKLCKRRHRISNELQRCGVKSTCTKRTT